MMIDNIILYIFLYSPLDFTPIYVGHIFSHFPFAICSGFLAVVVALEIIRHGL